MRPTVADADEDDVPSLMGKTGNDEVFSAISSCSCLLLRFITDDSLLDIMMFSFYDGEVHAMRCNWNVLWTE
jgi:hypothetical protein